MRGEGVASVTILGNRGSGEARGGLGLRFDVEDGVGSLRSKGSLHSAYPAPGSVEGVLWLLPSPLP